MSECVLGAETAAHRECGNKGVKVFFPRLHIGAGAISWRLRRVSTFPLYIRMSKYLGAGKAAHRDGACE